jgi:hypothetical protein
MPLDIEETIQIHFSSRFANNYVNDDTSIFATVKFNNAIYL